jgi:hypothetical protein
MMRMKGTRDLSTRGSSSSSENIRGTYRDIWEMGLSIDGLDLEGLRMCAVDGMMRKALAEGKGDATGTSELERRPL